jgi:hypothetical protein
VHEQHGKVRTRQVWLDQKRAVHVIMAAGLKHQDFAEVIEIVPDISALFKDSSLWQRRIARGDDPERLAARVHVCDSQFVHIFQLVPVEPKPLEPRAVVLASAVSTI